ncbi:gliding motility-associated C-terminal domain-containing protein [Kordia sp.]|uniref:gliding motility-associated C-terminal domain-containing protein n=1 Tax=Kordia sp. TaxID=1965332 RepID=UPI003B58FF7C
MKKITLLIMVTFFSALSYSQTVDCTSGPVNNTGFCYGNNDTTSFTYTSSDGSPLAVTFNAGQVENNWDELIITDSDGTTQIYNGYGNAGDLTGLSFESTGDTITIGITADGSISCDNQGYTPWDFSITCVDTSLPPSCVAVTAPVDGAVDVDEDSDIAWGSATGGPTGYKISIGTTPGGTDILNEFDAGLVTTYDPGTLAYATTFYVTIIPYNANGDTTGCTESSFTTRADPNVVVDCASGVPVNVTGFCYDNNNTEVFNFASSDGATLQIQFNSGNVENNWDELIIYDSDGVTELYNGYGNNGDLAGLIFESTGPSLSLTVTSDGSVSCLSSAGIQPWDYTVSCVDPSLPPTCVALTSPVDGAVDINEDEDISWTTAAGNPTGYLVTIGTTPGGNEVLDGFDVGLVNTFDPGTLAFSTTHYVTITPYNANGNATGCTEESFTIRDDPFVPVDCSAPPLNVTGFCYGNNDTTTFSYTSSDGTSLLSVSFNAGQVENNWDELIVFDSDGTEIYNDYGNAGDLAGLTFESTGPTITFQIQSDGVFSCQSEGYTPWDFIVSCIDPFAPPSCVSLTFPLDGATDVEIDQNITWGTAANTPSGYILNVGTTPGGTEVLSQDVGDVNTFLVDTEYATTYYVTIIPYNANGAATGCIEESFTTRPDPNQIFNLVCADGPINLTHCYTNNDDNSFLFTSDSGFPIRLSFTAGQITDDDDIINFYSGSDNTGDLIFSGNNAGDLAGLTIESTGGNLFMEIISDGFTSCASGDGTPWEWTAECLTCFKPTATYTVVEDCAAGDQFLIDVEILDTGDAASITITDDFGSAAQVATAAGVYTFGPYPNATPVVFTVADTDDTNCVLTSEPKTQPFCPDQSCRIINAGYDQLQTCDVTSTDLSATFMVSAITSDTSSYSISDLQCPPDNLTGVPTSITADDTWSSVIDLGFDFQFFGQNYTQLVIGANGLIGFDTSMAGENCAWNFNEDVPDPNLVDIGFGPDPLHRAGIFGAYHDIDPGVDGDHYIEYTTVGTAPSRQFKVTFFEVPHFSFACNDLLTTQQIILYESSNVVDVVIIEKPACPTWNGGNTVIGIQNEAGTVGYAPPGRNTSDSPWAVTEQELWRFVPDGNPNYTFEWLDSDGNVISNDTDITVSPTEDTTYTASITYALADGSLVTLTDDVTVRVERVPEIVSTETLRECDDDLDGIAVFDLTIQDPNILGDPPQQDVTISYYETSADAEAGTNMLADPTTYTSAGGTVYIRIENDITGCYTTGDFQIEVLMQIDPANIGLEGECINDEYTITVSPLNNGYDPATVTYDWSGGSSVNNDESQFIATEDGEYTVTITTADGCASMQTFTVINSMCSFPQGISPNGDPFNQTLDLRAFRVEEIEIFNSHGRSVYKKLKYTNEWEGQTNDNDNLPVGTYFYVLRLENGQSKNGWVYLNK